MKKVSCIVVVCIFLAGCNGSSLDKTQTLQDQHIQKPSDLQNREVQLASQLLEKYKTKPTGANYDLLAPYAQLVLPELAQLAVSREFLTELSRCHIEESGYGTPWGTVRPSKNPIRENDPLALLISAGEESTPHIRKILAAAEYPDMAYRAFYALCEIGHYGPQEVEIIYKRLLFHGRRTDFEGRQDLMNAIHFGLKCLQKADSSKFEQACLELLSSGNSDAKSIIEAAFKKPAIKRRRQDR